MSLGGVKKILLLVSSIIIITCFIRAAAAPWDPDGLIYHLQAPRIFLETGRIISLPDNAPGNYPLTIEMLFMAGMAFGSDTVARFIHVVYLLVFLGTAGLFAKRYFGNKTAWLTIVVLLSIPILPYWGTLAYADLGWAVFEFLSLFALILWQRKLDKGFIILGAAFAGFAMGSKYLAVGNMAILALFILWATRKAGKRKAFISLAVFIGISSLILLPWLIKNAIGLQNPIYPLAFGLFQSSRAQALWMEFMQNGFGAGRSFLSFLLLPWNIYYQHQLFATVGGTIEIPSLLFPFAFFALWKRGNKLIWILGIYLLARFGFWAAGAQQIRLLLPLYPVMAILAAVGLGSLGDALRNPGTRRILANGVFGGMIIVSLLYQLMDTLSTKPWLSILGWETKDAFLTRMVTDYGATRFIENNLPASGRILMLWDGRGYYCDSRCLPDTFHAQWSALVETSNSAKQLANTLVDSGIQYIMYSESDAFFLMEHDPEGVHRNAWDYLQNTFRNECTKEIYSDPWTQILEITCQG